MGASANITPRIWRPSGNPTILPPYAVKRACGEVPYLWYKEITGPSVDFESFVFADVPPPGYYRWLVGLAVDTDNASSTHIIDVHIAPPFIRPKIDQTLASGTVFPRRGIPFFADRYRVTSGISTDGHGPSLASVKISQYDNFSTPQTIGNASQGRNQVEAGVKKPFAIPAGWTLFAWDDTDGAGQGFHRLTLRMFYYELANGTRPPTVKKQLP